MDIAYATDKNGQFASLGRKYRDSITGITGTLTAVTVYLDDTPTGMLEWYEGGEKRSWFSTSRLEPVETA